MGVGSLWALTRDPVVNVETSVKWKGVCFLFLKDPRGYKPGGGHLHIEDK